MRTVKCLMVGIVALGAALPIVHAQQAPPAPPSKEELKVEEKLIDKDVNELNGSIKTMQDQSQVLQFMVQQKMSRRMQIENILNPPPLKVEPKPAVAPEPAKPKK